MKNRFLLYELNIDGIHIFFFLVSKVQRKSQSNDSTEAAVMLSQSARLRLEELMMEGDLLEVALDETQHIWRILSHTNSPSTVRKYASYEEVQTNLNQDAKDVKKRGRKRKSEEFELLKKLGRQKMEEKNLAKRKGLQKEKKSASSPLPIKRGPRKVFILKYYLSRVKTFKFNIIRIKNMIIVTNFWIKKLCVV